VKTYNTVAVTTVDNLEVGDLMAYEFLGSIVSGKVTGIAHTTYDLTRDQRNYMDFRQLEIPKGENDPLHGPRGCLVFGEFTGRHTSPLPNGKDHMYLDYSALVAVFPGKTS